MQRPDLSNVDPTILAYIEYLEKKAGAVRPRPTPDADEAQLSAERMNETLPAERETAAQIITGSQVGKVKRTFRHLYTRQHRGGMGVYGIDLDGEDESALFSSAEANQSLLLFTNRARVFRQAGSTIPAGPVLSAGAAITERMALEEDEQIVAILPEQARGYVALASQSGRVRILRHHLFGEHMRPGTALYNYGEFGALASVCWTPGDAELFIVTERGTAIRFAEKALSPQGDQGIRLSGDDRVVSITGVYPDSSVFIASADGRGALRQMSGFAPNKSAGGSGKLAIKSSKVAGAVVVEVNDDIFLLSRLGKVIRFPASEVPATEGVVQGVNCMGLRADEVIAVLASGPIY